MSKAAAAKGSILIVIRQFFPLAAGAETQALRQAKSYIAMGYPTRVLTARHDGALPREDVIEGVPVTRLPAPRVRFFGSLVYVAHLATYLVRNSDAYDAILAFHLKQSAMIAVLVGRFLRKPVYVSDQAAGEFGDIVALKHAPLGGVILWACRKASGFISGSSDITEELVAAGVPKDAVHLIPNGIPLESFGAPPDKRAARTELAIPHGAFVVVNVGRHTAQKDLATLLAGWREFARSRPNALLLLVGDGDTRAELERLSRELGTAASIRFEGWRSSVVTYLSAADVFAASSISEGTHLALGEAMAAGLPVVATPVGGALDYVSEGRNGLLFPVGDYRALAANLERLASDVSLRERMGRSAAIAARAMLEQGETARRHVALLFSSSPRRVIPARIRVMHLVATLDRGGTERQLAQLAIRMDKTRFDSEVICLTRGGPTAALLEAGGIPYEVIGKKNRLAFLPLISLVRKLLARPPHILHTWLFTSNLYGRIAGFVASADNMIASERSTDPWKSRWHRTVDRCLAIGTRVLVANSASVAQSLVAAGIPRPKIRVIPNGVDTNVFTPTSAGNARLGLGLPAGGCWFGYIGRLAFEKRPDVFLKVSELVLARMSDAHSVFFGEGPMLEPLRSQAARLKDGIVFFGDTPRVETAHAALDCLVLTSKWEGFPNVILEAMSTGRPVVAIRMPATEELVVDGETGFLVDDDPQALAAAVVRLLQDAKLSEEMGRKGRERVLERYSLDKMVRAYEELYLETVRGPGSHGVTN